MPHDIVTQRVEQSNILTPTGVAAVYRVVFMVGEHGPFTEEFRLHEFTPEMVRERQERIARTISQL